MSRPQQLVDHVASQFTREHRTVLASLVSVKMPYSRPVLTLATSAGLLVIYTRRHRHTTHVSALQSAAHRCFAPRETHQLMQGRAGSLLRAGFTNSFPDAPQVLLPALSSEICSVRRLRDSARNGGVATAAACAGAPCQAYRAHRSCLVGAEARDALADELLAQEAGQQSVPFLLTSWLDHSITLEFVWWLNDVASTRKQRQGQGQSSMMCVWCC